ncbi:hypothetical protein C8F01DRAFT_940816, partial [Mycena amicta]
DGWKNIAKTHVHSSVLTVELKSYLLRTHNMTGRPKTGDELLQIVLDDLDYASQTYGVNIIAIVTDD